MNNGATFQARLIICIEDKLGVSVEKITTPPQGMSSQVIFIHTHDDKEYVIKYGVDVMNDATVLNLIHKRTIDIPIPDLILSFSFENIAVIILQKIHYPLLQEIPVTEMGRYIPSMIDNLRKIHKITSHTPGTIEIDQLDTKVSWYEILLNIFHKEPSYWKEVSSRKGVDGALILKSIEKIIYKIQNTVFSDDGFSLLHTDFNQRNLFVDPNSNEITGIIDWEEAFFGDPLYDMARIRMYIWHFDLGDDVLATYDKKLNYTEEQKQREELYWVMRIIQYLGWYSEELTSFNKGRIQLHQDFLRNYQW